MSVYGFNLTGFPLNTQDFGYTPPYQSSQYKIDTALIANVEDVRCGKYRYDGTYYQNTFGLSNYQHYVASSYKEKWDSWNFLRWAFFTPRLVKINAPYYDEPHYCAFYYPDLNKIKANGVLTYWVDLVDSWRTFINDVVGYLMPYFSTDSAHSQKVLYIYPYPPSFFWTHPSTFGSYSPDREITNGNTFYSYGEICFIGGNQYYNNPSITGSYSIILAKIGSFANNCTPPVWNSIWSVDKLTRLEETFNHLFSANSQICRGSGASGSVMIPQEVWMVIVALLIHNFNPYESNPVFFPYCSRYSWGETFYRNCIGLANAIGVPTTRNFGTDGRLIKPNLCDVFTTISTQP